MSRRFEGFNQDKEEETEGALNVEISRKRGHDSLLNQGERFMQIFFPNGLSILGIYRGVTPEGGHVIKPTTFPNGKYFDEKNKYSERYDWRDEAIVVEQPIVGYRPADEYFLRASGNYFDQVKDLGKFLEGN